MAMHMANLKKASIALTEHGLNQNWSTCIVEDLLVIGETYPIKEKLEKHLMDAKHVGAHYSSTFIKDFPELLVFAQLSTSPPLVKYKSSSLGEHDTYQLQRSYFATTQRDYFGEAVQERLYEEERRLVDCVARIDRVRGDMRSVLGISGDDIMKLYDLCVKYAANVMSYVDGDGPVPPRFFTVRPDQRAAFFE